MSAPGSGHTAPGGDSIRLEDAHDLADASPEFRKLAFGDDDVVTGQLVDTTADSDEILDADLTDDEDDPDETLDFTGLADDLWDQA